MTDLLWLVPVLPVLAAGLIALLAKPLGERAPWIGVAGGVINIIIAVGAFFEALAAGGGTWKKHIYDFKFGDITLPIGLQADNLSIFLLAVVAFVATFIQLYSIGYMHGDRRFTRYFGVFNLFTSGMLGLVAADNFFVLLVSWEIMGLCSYLLISHYYETEVAQLASIKAFMTTRIGDIGLMLGIWLLYNYTGSFHFDVVAQKLPEALQAAGMTPGILILGCFLVFTGGVGKSAQFPLHTWLPDAMAGPTPASALIHAATMVAAGVYLVARTFNIFVQSPDALAIVAVVGAFTAIFAASIATVMNDIKKVLAYSTVSQLGYMMMALGVGGHAAGTFHLTTHAFFKALLFLCSGSVIHAVHTQEMSEMGGLRKKLPITFWTWMIGTAALMGVPPFSGFFSKDLLLANALRWHAPHGWEWAQPLVILFGYGTALLTAYYMTRATVLTFFGDPRDKKKYEHAHEGGWVMSVPLIVLGIGSALVGLVEPWYTKWATAGFAVEAHETTLQIGPYHFDGLALSLALLSTVLGFGLGYWAYVTKTQRWRDGVAKGLGGFYRLLWNKYYIDELYYAVFVRGTLALSELVGQLDKWVIDGAVNLVGRFGEAWADLTGALDQEYVDGAVNLTADATVAGGRTLRRLSTGMVQQYMMTLVVAVTIGVIIFSFVIGG